MNERTLRLYTGEKLSPSEEIQLIKEKISDLTLDINISEIVINANKNNIRSFEERLNELEIQSRKKHIEGLTNKVKKAIAKYNELHLNKAVANDLLDCADSAMRYQSYLIASLMSELNISENNDLYTIQ